MLWTLITILALLVYIGLHFLREYSYRRRHLDDRALFAYQYRKLTPGSKTYQHVITHLAICERCRDRMNCLNSEEFIEDHLVDD